MADKKISSLTERVASIAGADLLLIVGNTASTPTNYRVQVKNFLADVLIDLPQTTRSALKISANVTANATAATLAAGEFVLQSNSSIGITARDRVGLIVRNEILNGNSNVTGMMVGLQVSVDTGNSNISAANTFGLLIDHTIANTSWGRLVSPRAFIGIRESAGTNGNTTPYLLELGVHSNNVSANLTTGNSSVLYSGTADKTANRTLKIRVNGEDLWLLASNVAPAV